MNHLRLYLLKSYGAFARLCDLLLFALLCVFSIAPAIGAPASTTEKSASAKKTVMLQGGIDQVDYALKSSGVTLDQLKLPSLVNNVRLGSPAYYGGLAEGDKVLQANIALNKLNLIFERKGKRFYLSLHTSPVDLTTLNKRVPLSDTLQRSPDVALQAERPQSDTLKMKELARYDLVILVDTSGSMAEPIPSLHESKWTWFSHFLSDFSERTKGALKGRGLTLVPFNNRYKIIRNCAPDQVNKMLSGTVPSGGTDFASPLREVFENYFASPHERPLLVAIFTDGIPSDGPKIEHVIIDATKQMRSPNQVQVTFLGIGEDNQGVGLMRYLDDFLVHDGAHYDVVQTLGFEHLKGMSLFEALSRVLENRSKSVTGIESEIEKLREQIEKQREAASKAR